MKKQLVVLQNSIKTVFIFRADYIEKLISEGWFVIVIAPNDCAKSKKMLISLGAHVCDVPPLFGWYNSIKSILTMNYYVLKYRMSGSLFVCHFAITFLFNYFLLSPFNSRLIVCIEGLGSVFSNDGLYRSILRFMLTNNRSIRVFCNENERDLIGLPNDFVSNGIGINLSRFDYMIKKPNKSNSYSILYVGRLIKDKGVHDAISVFENIKNCGVDVTLNLVGDIYNNNPSSFTQKDIDHYKKKFGSNINFVGFSDDMVNWYLKSDVLLLPSRREGFPVCVMEASAIGLPSFCYDVPGCSDAIKVGVNGAVAKFGDIKSLSNLVLDSLNSTALEQYKYSCSTYALKKFDKSIKSHEFLNIVNSVFIK